MLLLLGLLLGAGLAIVVEHKLLPLVQDKIQLIKDKLK